MIMAWSGERCTQYQNGYGGFEEDHRSMEVINDIGCL